MFDRAANFRVFAKDGGRLKINIYNVFAEKIATVFDDWAPAGESVYTFDAAAFPQGMYFYELKFDDFAKSGKIIYSR